MTADLKDFISPPKKEVILTGDRPTGPLHLGHYVGSLQNRVLLQEENTQFVMIADAQALTDHAKCPDQIKAHVIEVAIDYLSVGIDPEKTTIFIQSQIPALFEIGTYFLNLVTWNRLKHNPTVKEEIVQKGFGEHVPAGFMVYPVFQAADITAFLASIVPVGSDQVPMIEETRSLVEKFNRTYHTDVLVKPRPYLPKHPRLPGTNGMSKMSKTLGNAIFLKDPIDRMQKLVKKMPSDPNHTKIEDPGVVEDSLVFTYLDAFHPDLNELHALKERYREGGLADSKVKQTLVDTLEAVMTPIQKKRKALENNLDYVQNILKKGTLAANIQAENTLRQMKAAMGIVY